MKRFWLECGGAKFALEPRPLLIGRSATCDLRVNDVLVSRRHARLTVGPAEVNLEDLGSSNGVLVNGERIQNYVRLRDGDTIQLGNIEFVLKSDELTFRNPSSETPATMPGGETSVRVPSILDLGETESTAERHAIDMLGVVADKIFALGRAEEAERILGNMLAEIMAKARDGTAPGLPVHVLPKAAQYAVRLAEATGRGKWIDYAIALFDARSRPLPLAVVDQMYTTVRKVSAIDLVAFRRYLENLRQKSNLNAGERFVLQRLEGLFGVASVGSRL